MADLNLNNVDNLNNLNERKNFVCGVVEGNYSPDTLLKYLNHKTIRPYFIVLNTVMLD